MTEAGQRRIQGEVFDAIADQYECHRAVYPEPLVDRACEVAALEPGAAVLEVGCGTGQLTRALLARGLRVTAVEPGANLVARARAQLEGAGEVRFVNARLEDTSLPSRHYRAVFSASAIHWTDPDVSWGKIADALLDGGTLALLSYFGLQDAHSEDDQQALRAGLANVAPDLAADWPTYRDLESTLAGVAERRENVSAVWAWLGGYEIACEEAAGLFEDVDLAALPALFEHTADELSDLLATMSPWARLESQQRDAVRAENRAVYERLGRPIRSSTVACLVTGRRRGAASRASTVGRRGRGPAR